MTKIEIDWLIQEWRVIFDHLNFCATTCDHPNTFYDMNFQDINPISCPDCHRVFNQEDFFDVKRHQESYYVNFSSPDFFVENVILYYEKLKVIKMEEDEREIEEIIECLVQL